MKYGVCANMVAQDKHGIGVSRIAEAAEIGFDYVELPLAQIMALSNNEFVEGPLKSISESGIVCACCNNFFPASIRLTGENTDFESALDYAWRALERVNKLGAQRVVFGSSGARNVPNGYSLQRGIGQIKDLLWKLGEIAKEHGILIVIEPLNRLESNIINTLSEGVALAREVAHPAVAALVDFYHLGLRGESTEEILKAKGILRHVHFARVLGRSMPVMRDEDNYDGFFTALRSIDYDETLSIEAYADNDFTKQAKHALQLLREIF